MLTANPRIRCTPHELAVVREEAVQMFTLGRGNLRGAEQAARFRDNLPRIVRACNTPGPFIYWVLPERIERRFPRSGAP